jgi:hypothetical protein
VRSIDIEASRSPSLSSSMKPHGMDETDNYLTHASESEEIRSSWVSRAYVLVILFRISHPAGNEENELAIESYHWGFWTSGWGAWLSRVLAGKESAGVEVSWLIVGVMNNWVECWGMSRNSRIVNRFWSSLVEFAQRVQRQDVVESSVLPLSTNLQGFPPKNLHSNWYQVPIQCRQLLSTNR